MESVAAAGTATTLATMVLPAGNLGGLVGAVGPRNFNICSHLGHLMALPALDAG